VFPSTTRKPPLINPEGMKTPKEQADPSAKLTLTALGIVFGDIGTSPLYALRECFHGEYGIAVSSEKFLAFCLLMFWSLIMIVTIKYLAFVLRADNNGEGGVLALTALLKRTRPNKDGRWFGLIAIGIFGAACYTGTA